MNPQRKNRLLIVYLCLILAVVISGCSGGNSNSSSSSASQSGAAASSGKLTDAEVTFTIALQENAAAPLKTDAVSFQELTRLTGIKLDIMVIPGSEYATKMNTLLAANQLPDFFQLWGNPYEIYNAGVLLPLRELVSEHAPVILNDWETVPGLERTQIDGDYYTLPLLRRDVNYEKGTLPFIRVDLLQEQNLPLPTTWDELYDTLVKLKAAYPDSIPYGSRGDNRLLVDTLSPLRSMGAHYDLYPDAQSGTWKLGRIQPEYKKALELYNKMYTNGILDSEYLVVNTQQWQEGLASGKYLYWYDNPTFADGINNNLKSAIPTGKFEPLPILENWYGERANYQHPDNYINRWGISNKIKNPELAIKLWNWLYSDQGKFTMNYGKEGETYELVNGEPQWLQSTIDKYMATDDPFYKVQSELGVGDTAFSPSWMFTAFDTFRGSGEDSISPQYIHNKYKDDPAIIKQPVLPPFTPEEYEEIKVIRQEIDDYSRTELNKFISGQRPLDQFDAFADELIKKGANKLEEITNAAEQRFAASN